MNLNFVLRNELMSMFTFSSQSINVKKNQTGAQSPLSAESTQDGIDIRSKYPPNHPSYCPEQMEEEILHDRRTILLTEGDPAIRKAEIKSYFNATMSIFERLHDLFNCSEAFFTKHETLRHPPIFYLGHTATFYMNKFILGKFVKNRIDPLIEMQTAVGVDEMSWDDLDTDHYAWPSADECRKEPKLAHEFLTRVVEYRVKLRALVNDLIDHTPLTMPIKENDFWYIILMGIEHDRIHLETSSVILRQAPLSVMRPSPHFQSCPHGNFSTSPDSEIANKTIGNQLLDVPATTITLGRKWEDASYYGWDNEFSTNPRKIAMDKFQASQYLVSNFEFYQFIKDGGYQTERFWPEMGWKWVTEMNIKHPLFWRVSDKDDSSDDSPSNKFDGEFKLRVMDKDITMPWDWPVECNNHEGAAFCAWKSEKSGKNVRLQSEYEYLALRNLLPTDQQKSEFGEAWERTPGNLNLARWASACPIDMHVEEHSKFGDIVGNVWQHACSFMDGFVGFRPHELYDDFTKPCFDGKHAMICGGSFISTGTDGGTRFSRFAFRQHFYQHAGFRYVVSDNDLPEPVFPVETNPKWADQLRFHFSTGNDLTDYNYYQKISKVVIDALGVDKFTKALDLGCGPGRLTMELTKNCDLVHGSDFTTSLFQLTTQRLLPDNGRLRWEHVIEGELVEFKELTLADLDYDNKLISSKTEWHQFPDPAEIDPLKFGDYNLIFAVAPKFFERLPNARRFLQNVHRHLAKDGFLVVATTYGAELTGGEILTESVLAELLGKTCILHKEMTVPYCFQETVRKNEYGEMHVTIWKKDCNAREIDTSADEIDAALVGSIGDKVEKGGQLGYEDPAILKTYLDFHFTDAKFNGNYSKSCADMCITLADKLGIKKGRALEIGGGPGRSAIELARVYEEVIGSDYSKSFVNAGNQIIENGVAKSVEGEVLMQLPHLVENKNISYMVLDACNLPSDLVGFDLICGFNLMDRLPSPKTFLASVLGRLNPGGLFITSSPYTWLESFTPKEEWIGAFKYGDNDAPDTYTSLKSFMLETGFVEAHDPENVWLNKK